MKKQTSTGVYDLRKNPKFRYQNLYKIGEGKKFVVNNI